MRGVVIGSLAGALLGGLLLLVVSRLCGPAIVQYPVHLPGVSGMQDFVDDSAIVSQVALILGVCTGAGVGAFAGSSRGGGSGGRPPV